MGSRKYNSTRSPNTAMVLEALAVRQVAFKRAQEEAPGSRERDVALAIGYSCVSRYAGHRGVEALMGRGVRVGQTALAIFDGRLESALQDPAIVGVDEALQARVDAALDELPQGFTGTAESMTDQFGEA